MFDIENKIFIGIEFTFSKEMFINTKLNKKININEYISDITYEDEKGWVSIIAGKYNCNILRISEKIYKMEFCIKTKEVDTINIDIASNIKLF